MAGKGDKPRPINKKIYNDNFDQIKWNQNIVNKKSVKKNSNKISFKY